MRPTGTVADQVPSPLFVPEKVWVFSGLLVSVTVTEIAAVGSSTVPDRVGVGLFVVIAGPTVTTGAVLSTVNVVDGPAAAAELPAESVAVPAAIEMPIV